VSYPEHDDYDHHGASQMHRDRFPIPAMSVRNCDFPWHWVLVTNDGDVLPCSHGSAPVGNLRQDSLAEIWNGPKIREVRASILRGEVHAVCRSLECPFQREDIAFPKDKARFDVREHFARSFDEAWYLAAHPDVAEAVGLRELASGLEHYVRHGRAEGRAYRLGRDTVPGRIFRAFSDFLRRWIPVPRAGRPLPGTIQCLVDYSLGRTRVSAPPVEVIVVVSTVCNLSCVMCPHGMGLVEKPRHMPLDVLGRAAPAIGTAARMIVSGLAEPMIAPAFWRILELTARRGDIFIRVNSNAHFLTEDKARRLLDSRLTEISFSLDAATPGTYAKIRGADLGRPVSAIRQLLGMRAARPESRLKVYLNMTLMRENIHEAAAFVELASDLGADAVVLSQLFTFGDRPDWVVQRGSWTFVYSEQMLRSDPDGARRHLAKARARAGELGMRVIYLSNVQDYLRGEPHAQRELAEAAV
jgi:MoaA/NifB/PqqE/SkfB family radical SAM enzyme